MSVPDASGDVLDRIGRTNLIPVAVVHDLEDARPLGAALQAGGLDCVEVTLRTPHALDVLRVLAEDPEMMVGAGTVTRVDQVDAVLAAGARFVVSPGFSNSIVAACRDAGVPVFPGVATATETLMALDAGLTVLKFFPAEACGGTKTLAALSAPYGQVSFIPTGGITADRLSEYLAVPSVLAVGGSWMVASSLLSANRFDEVTRLSAEAVQAARAARPAQHFQEVKQG